MSRLSDREVDQLADAMESFAPPGSAIKFANYESATEAGRRIGVMRIADCPSPGVTTCASFGLAHNDWQSKNFAGRIELVCAWDGGSTANERLLVTVADAIIGSGSFPKPGVIYEGAAIGAQLPELAKRMPHALLLYPYLWGNNFSSVELESTKVWFLQVVPIYDDEKQYIQRNDFKTFEELLSCDGAYFEQLDRPSHLSR